MQVLAKTNQSKPTTDDWRNRLDVEKGKNMSQKRFFSTRQNNVFKNWLQYWQLVRSRYIRGGLSWESAGRFVLEHKRDSIILFYKILNHEIIPFLWIGNWSKTYIIGASVGHLSWSLCRGLFQLFFPLQHFFRASLHPKTTIRGAAPNSTQLWSTLLILLNPELNALSAF